MFKELAKRLGFLPPQDARGKQDPAVESPEAPAPQDAGEPETSLELEPLAGIEELDPAALFAEEGPRPEEDASASPRNAQAEFEVGVQLCQMKEYLMGLEALTRAAEQGHAQAQFPRELTRHSEAAWAWRWTSGRPSHGCAAPANRGFWRPSWPARRSTRPGTGPS